MFPIVVAIIAAGRVFAYVVGTQNNQSNLISLLFILVGFFGPLFLLPRTFKWGGQAMSLAGNGIMRASSKVSERPKKFLDTRQEELSAERTRRSAERVAGGEGFNAMRPWRFPIDKFKSGDWDPTRGVIPKGAFGGRLNKEGSRRRQVAHDRYVQAGEESRKKDVEAARERILRQGQAIRARGGNWDKYFQQIADGGGIYRDGDVVEDIGKTSELERVAARTQLATLGSQTNWRYLEDYYEKSRDKDSGMNEPERIEARKFFDDNVDKMITKLPHLYTGVGAAADSKAPAIGQMHGVEVEAILSGLSKTINSTKPNVTVEDKSKAQVSLLSFLQNFQEAAANPNIRVDNGALKAVKGFLDARPAEQGGGGDFLKEINQATHDGRGVRKNLLELMDAGSLVGISPETRSQLAGLKTQIADRIDPQTGTYSVTPSLGEVVVSPTSVQPSSGTFPAPESTNWSPNAGTNTRIGPEEGETNIPHNE
ncbi:hypothetical protein KW801_03940 [Candidatus Saccharibacteria bacterium]|nr:hypothetical protein [Candidatus Saccharibacteria bacterium]